MHIRSVIAAIAMLLGAITFTFAGQARSKQSHSATEIRIQILDSHNHRPLKHRKVRIMFSGMDGQWYSKARNMTAYTGPDGIALFEVTEPIPPLVDVFVRWAYPCSNPEAYSMQSAIQNGVVVQWTPTGIKSTDESCSASSQSVLRKRQPGEIVFFVHPMNHFVWAWYDRWK
jgi:hypothetical protein